MVFPNSGYFYQDYLGPGHWSCYSETNCYDDDDDVCNEVEVYALPSSTDCFIDEVLNSENDIVSVNITCSATNIYPQAKCIFYSIKNDANQVELKHEVMSTWAGSGSPYLYNWTCQTTVPVSELGEGKHTFQGRVYPDVTGGQHMNGVYTITASGEDIVLVLPRATIACSTEKIDDYFKGREAVCECLDIEGNPRGTPHWFKDNIELTQVSDGRANLLYDFSNLNAVYTCSARSSIGVSNEVSLVPKFAYLDSKSVEVIVSTPIRYGLEDTTNITYVIVICRVPVDKVNPGLYFSATQDGMTINQREEAAQADSYYQTQFIFYLDRDGHHKISCQAQNSVFATLADEKSTTYQVSEENLVLLQQPKPIQPNNGDSTNVVAIVLAIICGILAVSLGITIFILIRKYRGATNKSDETFAGNDLSDLGQTPTASTSVTDVVQTSQEEKPQGNQYEDMTVDSLYANQSAIILSNVSSSETDDAATTYDVHRSSASDTDHHYERATRPARRNDYVEMKRPFQQTDDVYNN